MLGCCVISLINCKANLFNSYRKIERSCYLQNRRKYMSDTIIPDSSVNVFCALVKSFCFDRTHKYWLSLPKHSSIITDAVNISSLSVVGLPDKSNLHRTRLGYINGFCLLRMWFTTLSDIILSMFLLIFQYKNIIYIIIGKIYQNYTLFFKLSESIL
jgi:hypothetical protein